MAKTISLKIKDEVLQEVEEITRDTQKSRYTYINEALEFYNHLMRRKRMKTLRPRESQAVYNASLEVLREFEALQEELPD